MDGWFVVGLVTPWLLTGAVLAVVMRRHGHHLFVWFALGSVLGPFAVPVAWERMRDRPAPQAADARRSGSARGGGRFAESVAALRDALALLGDRVTSVTVALVLDHDERDTPAGDEALVAYAEAAGVEVIAVGARGRGASRTLFGSTAERLVGKSPVPVLVGRRRVD